MINILMEHGISSAKSYDVNQVARKVRQGSQKAIQSIKRMVEDYQHELESYMERITLMEAAEVERLTAELAH